MRAPSLGPLAASLHCAATCRVPPGITASPLKTRVLVISVALAVSAGERRLGVWRDGCGGLQARAQGGNGGLRNWQLPAKVPLDPLCSVPVTSHSTPSPPRMLITQTLTSATAPAPPNDSSHQDGALHSEPLVLLDFTVPFLCKPGSTLPGSSWMFVTILD